jgi:hypothetical protein
MLIDEIKINIVTEEAPGWVLRRISESLHNNLKSSYITSNKPDNNADINLYIDFIQFKHKTSKIDIGWFTHRSFDDGQIIFDDVAKKVDYCISMCSKTAESLPPEKTIVIKPCADPQFFKDKIVFGCSGRNYVKSGRKRFELIPELRKIAGVEILLTNLSVAWVDMPKFYDSIDYLLVLSNNEGGPMPVLEAIARRKPIIAPDVGFCWDYPVIKYNSIEELKNIIKSLAMPKNSWEFSGKETYDFCKKVYEKKYRNL